ncbi:unnamed protein product [Closterium sp. NIES-53]
MCERGQVTTRPLTRDHAGQTCGKPHTQHRCFSRLDDAWRAEFGDEVECPHLAKLLSSGVAIFDLDYDAVLSAMYALSASAEGDCYRCVPPDLGIEAAALGASESSLPSTTPAEALHTFTLDSGASRCFFRESTTLTPLHAPVPIRLADPSRGPVVARSSTVLLCPAVPSGSLSGLHLPLFSMDLVGTVALQDSMVTTTTPGGQRVSICMCTRTGRHLATFTRRPGSSLYTLATEPLQVAASAQVSVSGPVPPPCSCRLLSHKTLLWHHRLGHPSLPRLHGMHSRLLVLGLPRSLPPLPPSPAPPCLACVEERQRAAPHSSSFPPTTAPLQTLHMDVRGPALVSGQGRKRYFLLVVDDYMRYTTVFPLRSKGEVVDVLIPWIRAVRLQLRERFRQDLPVLRLHSDRGGEFSSDLLRDFCRGEGILQSFTLPASPQQNGIAERRIGLVMEVARTSMNHAAAPHFLWPFAVRVPGLGLSCLCSGYVRPRASALVAESESASPPSVGGECALDTDVLDDKQEDFECLAAAVPRFASMLFAPEGDPDAPDIPTPRSYAEAITGPYSSQWQTAMDAEMASWKSTGTYGVDYFLTFSPTPKMTTLRVLLHVAGQRDYELHSLDFSTAFLQGSMHEEIWLHRPPGFTGTTLAALGLTPSTGNPSLFLCTDTSLPPFYVLVYVDDLVFATADTEALTLVKLEL